MRSKPEESGPHTTENADLPISPERRNRYSSYAELENGASVGSSPHEVKETSVQFGMTAGVVLAAGESRRMGRAKGFLPHISPKSTFLGHLFTVYRAAGVDPIVVAGRPDDLDLSREVERLGGRFTVNPDPAAGQLSSLIAALEDLSVTRPPDAIVVTPVDVPLITADVVRRLIAAAHSTNAAILRAAYRGAHGHPVLFKRTVFDELRRADPSVGARAVVRADPARVMDVETDEPGVLIDVDTPEDYARVFGRQL